MDIITQTKMSPKTIGGIPKKSDLFRIDNGQPVFREGEIFPVGMIYGSVRAVEHKQTDFGVSTKFLGDFEAINKTTGEIFRSSALYLPSSAADALENAFVAAAMNADFVSLSFKFDIDIVAVEKSSVNYEYRCTAVDAVVAVDPFASVRAEMLGRIAAKQQALPFNPESAKLVAPVKDAIPEAPAENPKVRK